MANSLEFRSFTPMVKMIDRRLSERILIDIINTASKTVDNGELVMIFSIPPNTLLSEITVVPESDLNIVLLDNGDVRVGMLVPALAPMQAVQVEFDMFFAGDLTAPSYALATTLALSADEIESDAVGTRTLLQLQADFLK